MEPGITDTSKKFSLLSMYKNKKSEEIVLPTTFSFGLTPQKEVFIP
jgi:hypothetical protein